MDRRAEGRARAKRGGGRGLTVVGAGAALEGVHAVELSVGDIHAPAALVVHNAVEGLGGWGVGGGG